MFRIPRVLFRNKGLANPPDDTDIGIVPENAVLVRWVVIVATFIKELDGVRKCEESVGKSHRDINLILRLRGKNDARPFAKMCRTEPDIDDDVESFTLHYTAQFCLRMIQLVMKTAERPLDGKGVIILHERIEDAEFSELCAMVGFAEGTTTVAKDFRPELPDARKRCSDSLHRESDLRGNKI